ncbi:retrovirus-related Pol polyprotein from transposon opus [Trichonephila clavipes]|nr:retrovirus-related Pol polyprotein from transposon opus [Trichonephila clavipes]
MDKGSMVADSFRSEQESCAELALAWKHAKEGKGNYYEVNGYLFHRDKILGESIGQLVIPKCRTEVLKLTHTSVFSSHMGPKKTLERIKYSFFWEGLRANVKKFCESCKECQLTRSVRIKDQSPITPVARPELPFQVVNMDLIGPIDPPSSKGHKYVLCLVDQHTRWGEAVPLTSLSAKIPNERSPLRCYGCGKQGVIKSRCPTCNLNASQRTAVATNHINAYTAQTKSPRLTLIDITFCGIKGRVCADTECCVTNALDDPEKDGLGSLVVKVANRGWLVTSSNPVPLKTHRVGKLYALNLSRARASSHWYGVVVRRRGVVLVT